MGFSRRLNRKGKVMSSHTSILTEIMDLIELKNTLNNLEAKFKEATMMQTKDGAVHKVDVVIQGPNGRDIGLQKTKKGDYRFVTDCAGLSKEQLDKQKKFINTVKQKYAYNKVIGEFKKQGYIIVEEEKVKDNTIKLVARKWS